MNITMQEHTVAEPSTELTVQDRAALALVLTGEKVSVPKQSSRPTDRAMLGALALHFKVMDRIAFDWLYTFDFDAVSDALLTEDRV